MHTNTRTQRAMVWAKSLPMFTFPYSLTLRHVPNLADARNFKIAPLNDHHCLISGSGRETAPVLQRHREDLCADKREKRQNHRSTTRRVD